MKRARRKSGRKSVSGKVTEKSLKIVAEHLRQIADGLESTSRARRVVASRKRRSARGKKVDTSESMRRRADQEHAAAVVLHTVAQHFASLKSLRIA